MTALPAALPPDPPGDHHRHAGGKGVSDPDAKSVRDLEGAVTAAPSSSPRRAALPAGLSMRNDRAGRPQPADAPGEGRGVKSGRFCRARTYHTCCPSKCPGTGTGRNRPAVESN